MWFQELAGFREESPSQVREHLSINGEVLKSHVNGKEFIYGLLEIPSLADLRNRVSRLDPGKGKMSIGEIIADVQCLHLEPSNAGSVFQVASQFNLLEMVSPGITPEQGVDRYEHDRTQGPACAIAAGAGTIYRNYFADVKGQRGQTSEQQIDCLADIGIVLGNTGNRLWNMENGYALATENGLSEIQSVIGKATETERDDIRKALRIGIQWNTEVTQNNSGHLVTQAYCSALPVGYSPYPSDLWSEFARVILEATYEATICAAILNSQITGNNRVYLTLIGRGVFGNETTWIFDAIKRTLRLYGNYDLNVYIVSYGSSNTYVQELVDQHL